VGTFVLVHGAMHGGWCWRDVRRLLVADGHEVRTPTLTGQGDRRHQLTPDVGVDTHVEDVLDLLWFDDLTDVVLALHSYSGVLAGPVVERSEGRVRAVAYLGAFVTGPDESLLDVEPPDTARRYLDLAASAGDGWRIPASPAFLDQWGVTDQAARDWVGPRLTDFPLRAATEPTRFSPAPLASIPRLYVRHTAPPLPSLERSWRRLAEEGVPIHDISAGHDMMIEAPEETARLLQRFSSS
jgi:pimeloyl-ACP methyl ester carboxylesterase